jgi:hypothetical protein
MVALKNRIKDLRYCILLHTGFQIHTVYKGAASALSRRTDALSFLLVYRSNEVLASKLSEALSLIRLPGPGLIQNRSRIDIALLFPICRI